MKAILGIVIFAILVLGLLMAQSDPQYLGPNNPALKAAAANGGMLPWPNQYDQTTGQLNGQPSFLDSLFQRPPEAPWNK